MASGARRIVIEFLGKDVSAGRVAGDVEGKTSRLGAKMAKVGKIAAVGLAAGTVLAGKALFDMGKAAAEDAQGQAILAKALQNNANATKGQVAATEDWISAQGRALGVTDDELRPALSKLVAATHDVGKAQKLASLAMDVSAGTGKDLGSVSAALAKAQNGNVAGLARLGVATKDAHGKTLSFKQLQENLADTFGGSAKTKADTFAGKMSRLKLIFDETKESIGAKLLPIAERLATWFVDKGLPAIKRFGDWMSEHLGPVFTYIGDLISKVTGGMNGDVGKNLGAITSTFQSVVSIITSLWQRFGGFITTYLVGSLRNGLKMISGALQIIAGVFKVFSSLLKGDWKGVWDGIKQILGGAMTVIKAAISQALNVIKTIWRLGWSAIKAVFGEVWSGIKAGAASAVEGIKGKLGSLMDFLRGLPGKIAGAFSHIWQGLASGLKDAINAVLHLPLTIPRIDTHIPGVGKVGGQTLIPALAAGGVVRARRGGTLALLGEGGHDEAVVPLSGPHAPRAASGGSSTPIILQLDSRTVWQGLLKIKRDGRIELGLA